MQKAHEKLIESERNFKAAHAILTQGGMGGDGHSGLIGMDGHPSGHGPSFGHSLVPASPHSSSKRLSGNLMPEGSYEQSLFAQGHSTNAGSTGNHSGMPSTGELRAFVLDFVVFQVFGRPRLLLLSILSISC